MGNRIKTGEAAIATTDKPESLSLRDRVCRNVIDYGILGLIVFSPLPAASVYEWSILVIQLAILVMTAAYLLMKKKPALPEKLTLSLRRIHFAFLGVFIFLLIQVIPFPGFLVRIFSPSAYAFRELFSTDAAAHWLTFSLVPARTVEKGLELLAYVLLGFLIIRTIRHRDQIRRIILTLSAMGIFEAFYGLFELYNKNPRILFYKKIYNLDSVTGTFVNRNHFSGYLEMVIPLTLGLIIARIGVFSLGKLRWQDKVLRFSEKGLATNIVLSLGVVLMAIALIFSKSRAGLFVLALSFVLFFSLSAVSFGGESERRQSARNFLKVIFLSILLVGSYIGIQSTIKRFALDRLLHEGRPTFWATTLRIVSDFPLLGTGLGTFSSLYPDLDGETGPLHLSHAHNDYLEYLSEIGIVGMALLLGGLLFMVIKTVLAWRERRHPEMKGLALGGIIAICGMLVHSITDFNLHIPANLLLFTVVLSLTTSMAFYQRSGQRHHE